MLLIVLAIQPLANAQAEEAAVYAITANYRVTNNGPGTALNARMIIFLFDNISGWSEQTVLSENIQGVSTFLSNIESTADNRWVRVSVGDLGAGESRTVTVTQMVKVKSVKILVDPNDVGTSYPPETLDFVLSVDGLYESNNSAIQALSQQLTNNVTNPYYKARRIFDYLLENFNYEFQQTEHSALWALQNGRGDCTEFSNLFIALARAAGIPAKSISGFGYLPLYTLQAGTDIKTLGHAWSIFYLPNYGWVPADAVWPQYIGSFGKTDYAHIAGASTGGEGIVRDGTIYWPGPGSIKEPYITYSGVQPNVDFSWDGGTIIPEVFVDVSLQAPSQIQNDMMTLTMTVKNMGRNLARNLVAELDVDPTYFEVITSRHKDNLTSGEQWVTTFDVRLREGAYDNKHTFTSKVTYESAYGEINGTFLAKGETPVSIPAKPVAFEQAYNIMLFALIGVVIVLVVVAAAVVLMRR